MLGSWREGLECHTTEFGAGRANEGFKQGRGIARSVLQKITTMLISLSFESAH